MSYTHPYAAFIARATREHGDALDTSSLDAADPSARTHFNGPRVVVETEYPNGEIFRRAGVVSATTGWKPSLLLMHRVTDSGSWDLLEPNDKVVAVQRNGNYEEVGTRNNVRARLGYFTDRTELEGK